MEMNLIASNGALIDLHVKLYMIVSFSIVIFLKELIKTSRFLRLNFNSFKSSSGQNKLYNFNDLNLITCAGIIDFPTFWFDFEEISSTQFGET